MVTDPFCQKTDGPVGNSAIPDVGPAVGKGDVAIGTPDAIGQLLGKRVFWRLRHIKHGLELLLQGKVQESVDGFFARSARQALRWSYPRTSCCVRRRPPRSSSCSSQSGRATELTLVMVPPPRALSTSAFIASRTPGACSLAMRSSASPTNGCTQLGKMS